MGISPVRHDLKLFAGKAAAGYLENRVSRFNDRFCYDDMIGLMA
jgi:hypothetical protein